MSAAALSVLDADLDDLPALEVTCTGAYFIPMDPAGVRDLLRGWALHEHGKDPDYVERALATMARGEEFVSEPSGFRYRLRRTA